MALFTFASLILSGHGILAVLMIVALIVVGLLPRK